jgi:hypothetical protein
VLVLAELLGLLSQYSSFIDRTHQSHGLDLSFPLLEPGKDLTVTLFEQTVIDPEMEAG